MVGFNRFSKWQYRFQGKHPWVFQISSKVAAAIIVAFLVWIIRFIEPFVTGRRLTENEGKVTITSWRIMPLNAKYFILSEDSAVVAPEHIQYATIEPTDDDKVKTLNIRNLPMSKQVQIDIDGTDSAEIRNAATGNTVIFYPSFKQVEKENNQK